MRAWLLTIAAGALLCCVPNRTFVRVVDSDGMPVAEGGYPLDFPCDYFTAPGHLVDARCVSEGETVALHRSVKVELRCESDGLLGSCPEGVYRCLSPSLSAFGRCGDEGCDCPDLPDAAVFSASRAWTGESGAVVAGRAVLRRAPRGTIAVSGVNACKAVAWRQVGALRVLGGWSATCEDDVGMLRLPAGRYVVSHRPSSAPSGTVEVRDVDVVADATVAVDLPALTGRPVRVHGAGIVQVSRDTTVWELPTVPVVEVPAGARVVGASPTGCCVWDDPQGDLRCTEPSAEACHDWMRLDVAL